MSLRVYRFFVLLLVILPFLGMLLAIYLLWNLYVFPSDIILMLAMVLLTGLGITVGYHRMLTHDGFKTYAPIKAFFLICGCMGFEGGPLGWAGRHIQHHAHSDEDGDPHSPLHGFWHAHMGWMLSVDDSFEVNKYVPHLKQDPVIAFVDRYTLLWMILSLVLPAIIGGPTGLLWGGAVRLFLTTHITFSVNSICHTFGKRPFETTDESRNNWLIGLIGFGEGWHNNHHAFPRNAFHGIRWWQFDLSGLVIRAMEATGFAWDVQRVNESTIEAQQERAKSAMATLGSLREDLLCSMADARREMAAFGAKIFAASLTPTQMTQCKYMHQETLKRLDQMQITILRSTRLKKQRLLAYQKEAQSLLIQARAQFAMLQSKPS